jgi:Arc/MetJ-type ribon-helix-helix transcriptional regulator
MPRGRRARIDRPTRWEVSIPVSLAAEIELHIFDPVRRSEAFGARSALIQRLLREWLDKQKPKNPESD